MGRGRSRLGIAAAAGVMGGIFVGIHFNGDMNEYCGKFSNKYRMVQEKNLNFHVGITRCLPIDMSNLVVGDTILKQHIIRGK